MPINIFELECYQEGNERKHEELVPIKSSKNDSDKVIDLMLYKEQCVLIRNLHVY